MFTGGSRPKFSNKRATKIGKQGDFDAGLDDLDGDGTETKKTTAAASGQREFVNLSSSAKTGDFQREEVKERTAPVKPTFRGKANLTKTGGPVEDKSDGVVKTYDFGSVFKTENDGNRGGNPEERKRGGAGNRGRGGFNKGGRPFDDKAANSDSEDDFMVVKDGKRKPQRQNRRDASSSDDEGQGRRDNERFGGFGGRGGRGGMRGRGGRDGEEGVRTEGEGLRNARVERGGTRGDRGNRISRD